LSFHRQQPHRIFSMGMGVLAALFLSVSVQGVPSQGEVAHNGPQVAEGDTGPARYVPALYESFDSERALGDAGFADGHYRTPGGEGYDLTLDRFAERLKEAA
jgi:hypothetical protein